MHQKTSTGGGPTSHGWPDAAYFGRVRNELAAKGVFDLATEQQQRDELAQRKQARLTATSSSSASASSASASASGAAAAAGGGGGAASGTDDAERARIQSGESVALKSSKSAPPPSPSTWPLLTYTLKRCRIFPSSFILFLPLGPNLAVYPPSTTHPTPNTQHHP